MSGGELSSWQAAADNARFRQEFSHLRAVESHERVSGQPECIPPTVIVTIDVRTAICLPDDGEQVQLTTDVLTGGLPCIGREYVFVMSEVRNFRKWGSKLW